MSGTLLDAYNVSANKRNKDLCLHGIAIPVTGYPKCNRYNKYATYKYVSDYKSYGEKNKDSDISGGGDKSSCNFK